MPEIDLLKSPKLNQKLLLHEIISILTSRIFLKTSNPGILSILSITDPAVALEFFFLHSFNVISDRHAPYKTHFKIAAVLGYPHNSPCPCTTEAKPDPRLDPVATLRSG